MLSMQCDCVQKQHSAPIETIEVSENASDKVVEILKNYNRIFLVADENTYEVLGKKVEKLLKDAGKLSHTCILENPCLPTNANIGRRSSEKRVIKVNHISGVILNRFFCMQLLGIKQ